VQVCGVGGLKYQTFATWVQKLRRKNGTYAKLPTKRTQRADSVRWLEAVVQEAQDSEGGLKEAIVLELRGGGRVEISHVKQLPLAAALLRAIENFCAQSQC
jgi:hypothetical protein